MVPNSYFALKLTLLSGSLLSTGPELTPNCYFALKFTLLSERLMSTCLDSALNSYFALASLRFDSKGVTLHWPLRDLTQRELLCIGLFEI